MRDFENRKDPAIYRPRINEALLRIVKATNGDVNAARDALDTIKYEGTSWGYLNDKAVPLVSEFINLKIVNEKIPYSWGKALLEQTLGVPTAYPEIEYYPEEAIACLEQENYIGGYDADIIALWDRGDRESICHAHMEGFWVLGEDAIDFVEKTATELEG